MCVCACVCVCVLCVCVCVCVRACVCVRDPGLQYKSKRSKKKFIEIYTSSESWINKLFIDVWFVMIGQ